MSSPTSQYPAQLDTTVTYPIVNSQTPLSPDYFNLAVRQAVINIEATLGVNPASGFGTIGNAIITLQNLISNSTPSGNAGGDLGGTYPNPAVVSIQGTPVSSTTPILNQVLQFNGSAWIPSSISNIPSGNAGGDLSGTYPNPKVVNIQGIPITTSIPITNQVLGFNGTSWTPITPPSSLPPSGSASGDLGGTYPNPIVVQSRGLKTATTTISIGSAAAPAAGQVLTATSGTAAIWQTPSGSPIGFAGGDLGGNYPNPTVISVADVTTGILTVRNGGTGLATLTAHNVLLGEGSSDVAFAAPGSTGTVLISNGNSVDPTFATLTNTSLAIGTFSNITGTGTLTAGSTGAGFAIDLGISTILGTLAVADLTPGISAQILLTSSISKSTWTTISGDLTIGSSGITTLSTVNSNVGSFGSSTQVGTFTVNAKGLITAAGNLTISGVTPGGSAGGDLGGTYPNPTVVQARGLLTASTIVSVSGSTAPTSGQVLTATSSTVATWQTPASDGITQLTGDGTAGPGSGSQFLTLATVNSNVGSFGSSTLIPTITVNAKGLITAISTNTATVSVISGITVSGTPSSGEVLTATSSNAADWQVPSHTPTGSAGGDLSGTYPDPIVSSIQNTPVSSISVTNDGYTLISTGGVYVPKGANSVINVKNFGAKGDGSTDDTTAIQTALNYFQTIAGFNFSTGNVGLAPTLHFPTGTYVISSMLVLIACGGARIVGDGQQQTILQGTPALAGQPALLRLIGCTSISIEHMWITGAAVSTTLTAPAAAGTSSLTVASGSGLAAGQTIGLINTNGQGGSRGFQGESVVIDSSYVSGTTVPLTTALQYSYIPTSVVCTAVAAGLDFHQDYITYPNTNSTNNRVHDVQFGASYGYSCVAGFSTSCAVGADGNNDLHHFTDCNFYNCGVDCAYIGHSNSLLHTFINCQFAFTINVISAPNGGCAALDNCFIVANGTWLRISGTQFHPWQLSNVASEDLGRVLDLSGGNSTGQAVINFVNCDKKFPASTYHLTGSNFVLTNGSPTVTATSSLFTKELAVGQGVVFNALQNNVPYIVQTIVSDTHITLTTNYTGTGGTASFMTQALAPVFNLDAAQWTVNLNQCDISLGSDAATQYIVATESTGSNYSVLSINNCNLGVYGYALSNVNLFNFNTVWDSTPPVANLTGTCTIKTFGNGDSTTLGPMGNNAFGIYNGSRYNQFQDQVGSSGSAVAWYGGNTAAPNNANYKLLATDGYLTLNAQEAITFNVGTNNLLVLGGLGLQMTNVGIPLSNANINLTSSGTNEAIFPVLIFQGTLTANVVVTMPNTISGTAGVWICNFANLSLGVGPFTVTFSNSLNSAVLSSANHRPVMMLTASVNGFGGLALG